eukprot:CAMPEP_0172440040 /NCGR_PEP_ID=MMETSP1065-20121228/834_1 /TAXON_ID=265537 /ORGANISM="Amphiprora paludosa, Strain CCMP125" /LENGTH=247 /DNA_ID=CAMNT_0013188819 /DNA_START=36 /DNA_END=780 /DNA_ORIENTATION=-
MKTAIFASLLAAVSAFAPASQKVAQTTSLSAFEEELGVQPPLGLWDPFGLLNGADQERFERLRYVEIKHGRIAQLAFLGNILPRAGIYLPGNIDYSGDAFSSYPHGIAAIKGPDAIPFEGIGQIICFIGFLEITFMKDVPGTGNEFVGDFRNGFIDFGWDTFSEEEKLSKRAIELNNGRAAQLGILGLMVHEEIQKIGYDADLPIIDTFRKQRVSKKGLVAASLGGNLFIKHLDLSVEAMSWKVARS